MPRYSDDQIKSSREKLISSAFKLFRQKGYNGVGLDEVARNAGLTKGTFYAHFDSKRDLFDSIVLKTIEYRNEVFKSLDSMDEKERAIAFINWYLSFEHFQNVSTGCLIPKLAGDLSDHFAENYLSGSKYIQDVVRFFEKCGLSRDYSIYFTSSISGALALARALSIDEGSEFVATTKKQLILEISKLMKSKTKEKV